MWEQIRANKRRSLFLITLMALVLLALGGVIAMVIDPRAWPYGMASAAAVFLVMLLLALAAGRKLVLMSAGAREIEHDDFDPIGTASLIVIYFIILVIMWVLVYFVEFLGRGPTVIG